MVDESGAEIAVRVDKEDTVSAGGEVAVRTDLQRMTLDEARAAFQGMLAIDTSHFQTQEQLIEAFSAFPSAVSVLAPAILDRSARTEDSTLAYHRAKWTDDEENVHRMLVNYPMEVAMSHFPPGDVTDGQRQRFRSLTTPERVKLTTNTEEPGRGVFHFDYQILIDEANRHNYLNHGVVVVYQDPEGNMIDSRLGKEQPGGEPGGNYNHYNLAARGMQDAMRILLARDQAITPPRAIGGASTPPAITQG